MSLVFPIRSFESGKIMTNCLFDIFMSLQTLELYLRRQLSQGISGFYKIIIIKVGSWIFSK